MNFIDFFTDPILRAPTICSLFMCVSASIMGVILFLQKRLLVSETVSHAAYPGALGGIVVLSFLEPSMEIFSFFYVIGGAVFSSWLSLKTMAWIEKNLRIPTDASLCLILASFFGIGVLISSFLQQKKPLMVSLAQSLLFGQVATLTDEYIYFYGVLTIFLIGFLAVAFRPIRSILFDREFSQSIGIWVKGIDKIIFWFLLLALIAGIRSVGVILMSGMLIAPSIAASQFTNSLKKMFVLASLIGAFSGLLGNILSVHTAFIFDKLHLPTGPLIVLISSLIAFFSLCFSPKKGIFFRYCRYRLFHLRCLEENFLKEIWKKKEVDLKELGHYSLFTSRWIISRLIYQGFVIKNGQKFSLTQDGKSKALTIVRLHRLWELYLTEQLGVHAEKVHGNAEEMEHILTPELEKRLTHLLSNPKKDPHQQPIPERRGIG